MAKIMIVLMVLASYLFDLSNHLLFCFFLMKLHISRGHYALLNAFLWICILLQENGIMHFLRSLNLGICSTSGNHWSLVTSCLVVLDYSITKIDIYYFYFYSYILLLIFIGITQLYIILNWDWKIKELLGPLKSITTRKLLITLILSIKYPKIITY